MAAGGNWIQSAIKRPGALKAKAKSAGMSTGAFARAHAKGGSTTARQSRLAMQLAKFHKAGRFKKHEK